MNFLKRWVWRRTEPTPVIRGINDWVDVDNATLDSLFFHGLMKKAVYKILMSLPKCPKNWIAHLNSNNKILYEIFLKYAKAEGNGRRLNALSRAVPWFLCLLNYDDGWDEIGDWWLNEIIEARDQFSFNHANLHPDYWFRDGRGRKMTLMRPAWEFHFKVHHRNSEEVYLDRPVNTSIIAVWDEGEMILLIDRENSELDGKWVKYPILSQSRDIREIMKTMRETNGTKTRTNGTV